jgi:uncharacterized protein YheU (UPF0270 family)
VPLWSNNNPKMALPLGSIEKLVIEVTPMARPEAVIHPSTPTLAPIKKEYSNLDWWVFSGTATAKADIYNVKLAFWGKVGEFFVGDTSAFHMDDFLKGQTWEFQTLSGVDSEKLDDVVTYFDFINGTEAGVARLKLNERDAALATAKGEAVKLWQGTELRREQFRALKE